MEKDVAEGRFRADLWFRLAKRIIRIPPLHERIDDIDWMVHHMINSAVQEIERQNPFQIKVFALEPAALRKLKRHRWPGNVRELRQVIQIAVEDAVYDVIQDAPRRSSVIQVTLTEGYFRIQQAKQASSTSLAEQMSPYQTYKKNADVLALNQIAYLEVQGLSHEEICKHMGVGRATLFRWKRELRQQSRDTRGPEQADEMAAELSTAFDKRDTD